MSAFSISDTAMEEIHRILHGSAYHDPVARLYEKADPKHLFDNVKAALRDGNKSQDGLKAISIEQFEKVGDQLNSQLAVGAAERAGYLPEHLTEVSGVTFVMSSAFCESLNNYCLIFDGGNFWLMDSEGGWHTLRTLRVKSRSD